MIMMSGYLVSVLGLWGYRYPHCAWW